MSVMMSATPSFINNRKYSVHHVAELTKYRARRVTRECHRAGQ